MARVASLQYNQAVHLTDSLRIPVHRALSGLLTWNNKIKQGVDCRLPEAMMRAAKKAKVQFHINEESVRPSSSLMSHASIVPAGRGSTGKEGIHLSMWAYRR